MGLVRRTLRNDVAVPRRPELALEGIVETLVSELRTAWQSLSMCFEMPLLGFPAVVLAVLEKLPFEDVDLELKRFVDLQRIQSGEASAGAC